MQSANKKTSTKKDNNNTEIAEKKAQLKQKINDLKKQLLSAQSELENAQKAQSDAQSDVDSLQAQIASAAGVDMVIANGADFHIIHKITEGRNYGTLFVSQPQEEVYLIDIIDRLL